jgi:membrane-bound lytic murein transglycosylase B
MSKNFFSRCLLFVAMLGILSLSGWSQDALAKNKPQKIKRSAASKKAVHKKAAHEEEYTRFSDWSAAAAFIDEMHDKHGFDAIELRKQLNRAHFLENVVQLINPPPPTKLKNWTVYRQRFIEPVRIKAGIAFWNKYESQLARAESEYGVPAEIIVGIIGVETLYGRMAGKIRVMDALTTLAFAYPKTMNRDARMAYFKSELEQTLLYARENNIDPFSLLGSYAGAVGWPQFMPGSIRRFAVDYDGDGKIDLRNSPPDAIGSVASFLSQHGWNKNAPLVSPITEISSDETRWQPMLGKSLEAEYSVDTFRQAGVIASDAQDKFLYGLVDLQDGERPTLYWLGSENFFAITKYNRSFFYAMSVIELGSAVKTQRTK